MNVDVLTPEGTSAGSVELPAEYFDVQVNVPLIHQVVVAQLAAARQGTHDTKTRGEIRGGGRKPYKQKGTGRARQGSIRAPQFTGGGVVHGPTPRDYAQRTPKKMKAAALLGALSDRARNNRVHVVSEVVIGEAPSAKSAAATLAALTARPNVLAVVTREDIVGWKSLRNLAGVHLLVVDQLNTYDVLCSDDIVFTSAALREFLDSRPAGKAAEVAAAAVAEQSVKAPSAVPATAPVKAAAAKPAPEVGAEEVPAKAAPRKSAQPKVAAEAPVEVEATTAKRATGTIAAAEPEVGKAAAKAAADTQAAGAAGAAESGAEATTAKATTPAKAEPPAEVIEAAASEPVAEAAAEAVTAQDEEGAK